MCHVFGEKSSVVVHTRDLVGHWVFTYARIKQQFVSAGSHAGRCGKSRNRFTGLVCKESTCLYRCSVGGLKAFIVRCMLSSNRAWKTLPAMMPL